MTQELGRILSIDDEDALRESIVAYLEDSGFTVYEARDGAEGLAKFRELKPDLVLSDLQMPVMGGLAVLEALQQESPDTPVIVISGAGNMSDAIEALRLGAWDYLLKPIKDMAVLEHAVVKSLERARLTTENRAYRMELESRNEALQKSLRELKADQQAGRAVQTRLLPEVLSQFGEYTVSFAITPSLYLSGDFTDYFEIDDSRFGFYIADVSGHGAASAFVTVYLKTLCQRLLDNYLQGRSTTILYPQETLAALNQEIYAAKLGKYLTMVYGVVDTKLHQMVYAVGGHFPSPVAIHNEPAFLPGRGFAIGMNPKATFETMSYSIPMPFTLAMFSDGVMEILPGKNLEEKEATLLKLLAKKPITMANLLEDLGLSHEQPEGLPDDVGILLIERKGR